MLVYNTNLINPYYNLATEEYLTKTEKYSEPILMLWQNDNSIIVGRNQNSIQEINSHETSRDNVHVVRRNTGGGTVYHDLGNLNFSLIYTEEKELGKNLFAETIQPVIDCLNRLGVKASIRGKNDIEVDGKKISGNAMWKHNNRVLHHGTLLFKTDLSKLNKYLNVDKTKIESKKIKSNSSRVANINDFVELSIDDFKKELIKMFSENSEVKEITFTKEEMEEIKKLSEEKYMSDDWNYSKSGHYTYKNKMRIEGKGTVEVLLEINEGKIKLAKFYGDFLGSAGTDILEKKLLETNYKIQDIKDVLEKENLKHIFGELFTLEEILNLIIQ